MPAPAGASCRQVPGLRPAGFDDDDLFISDGELPDVTGFGARQREINEQQPRRRPRSARSRPFSGPRFASCATHTVPRGRGARRRRVAEVLATLREREETSFDPDPATARHMKYRATLIEWILEVCADFGFGPTTADLAVQHGATRSRPIFLHWPIRSPRAAGVESRDPRERLGGLPRSHLTIASPDVPAGSRPEQGERAQDLAPAGGDVLSGSCR